MNFKNKIYLVFLVLLPIGCAEDFLEVENLNNLSESSFYQNEQDFEDLIISCYMPIGHAQSSTGMHVINFAMDDRVLHEQVNTSALQYDATNGAIFRVYASLFIGVYRANLFLQKFTPEIKINEERRKTMLGEAHFFRALYYYCLATWFEVPPLLLLPPEDPKVGYNNATQEEVYALVESEFILAIEMLPDSWPSDALGRATKGAARAFLGKTYLIQSKFQQASTVLGDVINSRTYSLNMPQGTDSLDYVYAYLSNFTPVDLAHNGKVYTSEFNSESIYEINYSATYNEGDRASQYLPLRRSTGNHMTWFNGYASITNGFGNIAADDKKFPNEFEPTPNHPAKLTKDPRFYAFYLQVGDLLDFRPDNPLSTRAFKRGDINSSLGTTMGLRKHLYPFHTAYTHPQAPFHDPNNWRLMRYAEVLLMYAEATVRASNNFADASALDALNQVRNRAGLEPLNVLSKEAIIHERDIELAGEHKRFWDLARWYTDGWLSLSEVQKYKPTFQPRHVAWPIPQGEIDRHYGELKQNSKW